MDCWKGGTKMPLYLINVAYTPEAWATMVKNPQDRLGAISKSVERLGGKVKQGYLCFGEYDTIAICEFPDNVSAAAFAVAVSSGGAVKACHTTPLMTTTEGIEAMKKAGTSGYEPPG
jgi:uncharacterized protein with GYD domain